MQNTIKDWVTGAVGKISAGLAALGAVIVSSVPSVDAASLIDT
ncbi:MAG: hypothetical protein U9Q15_03140 [Patescibacteria group bacterium]|nr:hypothetical protein [Patescibacteria group bacterium]